MASATRAPSLRRRSSGGAICLLAVCIFSAWQCAFVAPRPPLRKSRLALRATTANPVTSLREAVEKAVGHQVKKGAIRYTVQSGCEEEKNVVARVQLHCFRKQPVYSGHAAATTKEAEESLATDLLANEDFLKALEAMSQEVDEKSIKEKNGKGKNGKQNDLKPKQKKQKKNATVASAAKQKGKKDADSDSKETQAAAASAEKSAAQSELHMGQKVTLLVKDKDLGGIKAVITSKDVDGEFVDLKSKREAYIPVAEMARGFPNEVPEKGDTVVGRILFAPGAKNRLAVTLRRSSLERPKLPKVSWNASSLTPKEWYVGKVFGMNFDYVSIAVKQGEKSVAGKLTPENFSPAFWKEAAVGATVRVQVRFVRRSTGEVEFSMLGDDPSPTLFPGQEVRGSVVRIVKNEGMPPLGIFLDIGAERYALLPIQEVNDGFPKFDASTVELGSVKTCRILDVADDGRITLTRRSGDLHRPDTTELRNTEEAVAQYGAIKESGEWVEGEVMRMFVPDQILVQMKPQGYPKASGLLRLRETSREFATQVYLGQRIKVRVKDVLEKRKQLYLSMKPSAESA